MSLKRISLYAIAAGYCISSLWWGPMAEAAFHLDYAKGVASDDGMAIPVQREVSHRLPPAPRKVAAAPDVQRAAAPTRLPVASGSVWDRLAGCESGGNWASNTGNGYYGGIQFSASTWRAAGGTRYAPYAHQATREQQIEIASAWLSKTSWSQWPACSRRLGLR